jgi:hypothetical protein
VHVNLEELVQQELREQPAATEELYVYTFLAGSHLTEPEVSKA